MTDATNPDALRTAYDEIQAMIDGDLAEIEGTPLYVRRRACVDRARAGRVVLAN